jgi:hypothetical protein
MCLITNDFLDLIECEICPKFTFLALDNGEAPVYKTEMEANIFRTPTTHYFNTHIAHCLVKVRGVQRLGDILRSPRSKHLFEI